MKNRLITCVLACLMIFLVGCNGNTAKEATQEITKTETSFPAGNTETHSQEETEKSAVREKATITADESQSTAESQTVATVQTKPAEEKSADNPVTEKPKTETPQQTPTQAIPEKQPEQLKVSITYFVSDKKKAGGSYQTTSGIVKRIDEYERVILMQDGAKILIDDILDLQSDFFIYNL